MSKSTKQFYKTILLVLFLLSALTFFIQFTKISAFNRMTYSTMGFDEASDAYMSLHGRMDNASSWLKRDFMFKENIVDFTGTIFDATVMKNIPEELSSWTLKINFSQECYINSAWCGTVEIHQHSTSNEKVQTLDLRKANRSEIFLECAEDPDLMIALFPGDYIIYYPDMATKEMPVSATDAVTVGFIMYYLDNIDLSNYELIYHCHKNYTEGAWFILAVILVVLFVAVFISAIMYDYIYKKAAREMELKKSGISCMSEIYSVIYIVDLEKNTLISAMNNSENDPLSASEEDADARFRDFFEKDSTEAYKALVSDFVKLDTVSSRMQDRNNMVCEYQSNSYGWCRIRFIAMERKAGKPLSKVLFTLHDINEEKNELSKIESRVEKAESENRAKSTFLANMSHEIRTPINTVLGLDTMILRESHEDNVRVYAKNIKNAGNMLLSLINGILDFSKLEAGRMELVPAEYSLKSLIYDVKSITFARFENKHLDFSIKVDESIPEKLYGDDVRLKQIVINLLTNAAKYTEKGGVVLSVAKVSASSESVRLLFSVKDTGLGIKDEDKKKLSERFSRFDLNTNRNVEGTGIGINLVTGLLKLMDSELKLNSVYGKGSDFYFEIEQKIVSNEPVGQNNWNELSLSEDDEYTVSFKAPKASVLVVDDNDLNLMVFTNLLKETELIIDTAASGREALSKTLNKKYDIIFMDHMMPEMDGIETFEAIKNQKDGLNTQTPEIILTANALQGAREEYLSKGFNDFLAKPIQPDALEAMIVNTLPKDLYTKSAGTPSTKPKKTIEFPEIEGVDTTYALEHIGSPEGVINVMKQFVNVAKSDSDELMGYYDKLSLNSSDSEALKSFRIKVHAMKTSAGLFGALQLYGFAASIERAAREENVEEVLCLTPYFVSNWLSMKDIVAKYFESTSDKPAKAYDKEKFLSILHQLTTSMKAYDISGSDKLMDEITKFSLDDSTKASVENLKTAVANLDAEAVEKICKEINC